MVIHALDADQKQKLEEALQVAKQQIAAIKKKTESQLTEANKLIAEALDRENTLKKQLNLESKSLSRLNCSQIYLLFKV